MTAGTSSIGQQFNIPSVPTFVGVPAVRNTFNQFDEHGLILGLQRLNGETNWEYKRRLMDVFVHRANSSYRGLVYGITRELGLSLTQPMLINPKVDSDGNFLAQDPYIKFDGVWLYLYSDYANGLLDYKIDRYQVGGNYEHLYRLVNVINTTAFFEASLLPNTNSYQRSMTILNQSNRVEVRREPVPATNKFKVAHPYMVKNSIVFSDQDTFRTEVFSSSDVNTRGRYYIDYTKGIVFVYSTPGIGTEIRYSYTDYPFKPLSSPVILYDINSNNFDIKMFEQVLLDDGTYTNGLPTEIGVDILNELYSVSPLYYGV